MSAADRQKVTPRTVMVGGKAFATYTNAKRIVKLVNDVGAVVNNDADVNKYLKVSTVQHSLLRWQFSSNPNIYNSCGMNITEILNKHSIVVFDLI